LSELAIDLARVLDASDAARIGLRADDLTGPTLSAAAGWPSPPSPRATQGFWFRPRQWKASTSCSCRGTSRPIPPWVIASRPLPLQITTAGGRTVFDDALVPGGLMGRRLTATMMKS